MSKRRHPSIKKFLKGITPRPGNKCIICSTPELKTAVTRFQLMRKLGKTDVSWNHFHFGYVVPVFGRPRSLTSLMSHLQRCSA